MQGGGSEESDSVVEVTPGGLGDPLLGGVRLIELLHVVQSSGVRLQPRGPTTPAPQHLEEGRKQAGAVSPIYWLLQGPGLRFRFQLAAHCSPSFSPRCPRTQILRTQPSKAAKAKEDAAEKRHGVGEGTRATSPRALGSLKARKARARDLFNTF